AVLPDRSAASSQRRLIFSVDRRAPGESSAAGSMPAAPSNARTSSPSAASISAMLFTHTAEVVRLLITRTSPPRRGGLVRPMNWPLGSMTVPAGRYRVLSGRGLRDGFHRPETAGSCAIEAPAERHGKRTSLMSRKPWLATYRENGIPAEIDPNAYRSVVEMLE